MRSDAQQVIARKRESLERVKAVPDGERTFANTVAAMEVAGYELDDLQQQLQVLAEVHPDAAIRDAAHATVNMLEDADIGLTYDRELWRALTAWEAHKEHVTGADAKLAADLHREMRRMGFGLSDADFSKLKAIIAELEPLEKEFEKAMNDWEASITVTREQLDGLPDRYVEGLTRNDDGTYRISLDYPELHPFLRNAHDDAARRELSHLQLLKGGAANMGRLARMIQLRQDRAALLGFATHADYACEPRMARTGAAVRTFLERIITQLKGPAQLEMRALIETKKKALGLETPKPIYYHEFAYWSDRLLRERHQLDAEELKQYFPLSRVMDGMHELFGSLFGLRITPVPADAWHADVAAVEVSDTSSGHIFGHILYDLFPREGKYGHAATFQATLGRITDDGRAVQGMMALVCNFSRPTASTPSLLTHNEVETLLHEFGHAVHALVSQGRWQSQNGFGVALDFVEAPSQIMEEWAWDRASLDKLSGHWKTGERIPDTLYANMVGARGHMQAHYYLNLAVKALYDLAIHSVPGQRPVDPAALAALFNRMQLEARAIELPTDAIYPAGWSHLADYDAGYYSYLWSKVYALDLFSAFADDTLSQVTGARYRARLLAPGASAPELELVRGFLQREPSDEAFLARLAQAIAGVK
jgi:thimet oligopeptidase